MIEVQKYSDLDFFFLKKKGEQKDQVFKPPKENRL